jgi:hypothetical protein
MKTGMITLGVILEFFATAHAAELLWANFDTNPVGSIATQPGWARAAWLTTTQTGQVSSAGSYSDSHCLELPWHANGSSAVYTNFNSIYDPTNEHPVIRCSAKLFTPNTNMPFQVGLRNTNDGSFLKFTSGGGLGLFGFLYHDAVFVPLVTNRFADVTFFYNRSNNEYRLDYDDTNRLTWGWSSDAGPVAHTQFNQFVVTRLTNTASTTGLFLVDNVRVETFPPHVWAWWRCSDQGHAFVEQLGAFKPHPGYADTPVSGASDPVYDGTHDFHNEGARRNLVAEPAACAIATPASANWTVEAVFRMDPGEPNVQFIDWGKGLGADTNGSWISFFYSSTKEALIANCRDSEESGTDSTQYIIGVGAPNGRWHHAALVKNGMVLSLYLDYEQITNISLVVGSSEGTYAFNSQSHATIGQSLNYGNTCGPNTVIDEVRVSGKSLERNEFLQPGQPYIVEIMNSPTNNPWRVAFKGILGRTYRAETSPVFGPGAAWSPAATATVASTFGAFNLPSAAKTNFVRILRQ